MFLNIKHFKYFTGEHNNFKKYLNQYKTINLSKE